MTQKQLFILSFFGLFLLVFLQLIGIFRLFLNPLLWGVILALVFSPLFNKVSHLLRGRKTIAALLITFFVLGVTLGPFLFFSGTLAGEIVSFIQVASQWIQNRQYEQIIAGLQSPPFGTFWQALSERAPSLDLEIVPLIQKFLNSLAQTLLLKIQAGAKDLIFVSFNYALSLFILFFFLRDGHSLAKGLKDLFPMTQENKEAVFSRLAHTLSAVVQGLVVTGVVQALLGGIAFWVLGVPYPLFFALLIAFLALVPIGGAVLVWFPCSLWLGFSQTWVKGLILFLWGALVISMVDNFLKPLLIGERTKLPTLFLFLAILGGLSYYGFIGIFLGPVMLALFLTLVEIYRREYPGN